MTSTLRLWPLITFCTRWPKSAWSGGFGGFDGSNGPDRFDLAASMALEGACKPFGGLTAAGLVSVVGGGLIGACADVALGAWVLGLGVVAGARVASPQCIVA